MKVKNIQINHNEKKRMPVAGFVSLKNDFEFISILFGVFLSDSFLFLSTEIIYMNILCIFNCLAHITAICFHYFVKLDSTSK